MSAIWEPYIVGAYCIRPIFEVNTNELMGISNTPIRYDINEVHYEFRSFGDIISEKAIAIYMANVGEDIAYFPWTNSYWIPFELFTKVYEGVLPVNLPQGFHDIPIILDTPFEYLGENLVIYIWKQYDVEDRSNIENSIYNTTSTASFRSFSAFSRDEEELNPLSPPRGYPENDFSNITLVFDTIGYGKLHGIVSFSDTPLEGVEIQIKGTEQKSKTNAQGEFSIQLICPEIISITASKEGFYDVLIEDIEILAGEITFITIFLIPKDVSISEYIVIPSITNLNANYPNPFNPSTFISFDIATESIVFIEIFNIKGQKVKTLVNEFFNPGSYDIEWNGNDDSGREVSSGIYFYQMRTSDQIFTRRMVILK